MAHWVKGKRNGDLEVRLGSFGVWNGIAAKRVEAAPSVVDADVLIVVDGDAFRSPWASADTGTTKSGSLINWNWRVLNNDAATYEGTKWPNDWGSLMRAIRLVPAA